jgi:ferrous iron transport protein A
VPSRSFVPLSELPNAVEARIVAVHTPGWPHADLAERLAELGFLPGERVRVLARGALKGPLAVRVGSGTFALRLAEAMCVRVTPLPAARSA